MLILFVGLGGAVGAILRYLISLLPWHGAFPVLTLITNVLGALAIGVIAGLASFRGMSPGLTAFLKVGLCGGFTTLSTFSLQAYTLFNRQKFGLAVLYIALSTGLCLGAVLSGMLLAEKL